MEYFLGFAHLTDVPGSDCSLGDVRLFGGSSANEGRVEICLSSGWGTVSTLQWSPVNARVACHDAGFGGPGECSLHVGLLIIIFLFYIERC